jgi:hypothetical protein
MWHNLNALIIWLKKKNHWQNILKNLNDPMCHSLNLPRVNILVCIELIPKYMYKITILIFYNKIFYSSLVTNIVGNLSFVIRFISSYNCCLRLKLNCKWQSHMTIFLRMCVWLTCPQKTQRWVPRWNNERRRKLGHVS